MVLHATPTAATRPSRRPDATIGARTAQPVEVRTGGPGDAGPPEQILWRGRLWLVRQAQRLGCRAEQTERWAVEAGDGSTGHVRALELVRLATGTWQLHEECG